MLGKTLVIILLVSALAAGIILWAIAGSESLRGAAAACTIGAAVLTYIALVKWGGKRDGTTCRGCCQVKDDGSFALHYGENEGLCRECLDKYLPLALQAGEKEITKV